MTITIIQPSSSDFAMRLSQPDTNFNTATFNIGNFGSTDTYRTGINFNFSSLPSSINISNATMSLYCGSPRGSNIRVLRVFELKRTWVENQATWNIYSTGNSWQVAGATGANDYNSSDVGNVSVDTSASGWVNIPLSVSTIQTIVNSSRTNYGWLLKFDTESNDQMQFYSRGYTTNTTLCPKLSITYTSGVLPPMWFY